MDEEVVEWAGEVNRRQRYRRQPQRVADVLSGLLARRGYARVQADQYDQQAWRDAVGERFSRESRPGNVRGGILEVIVSNSAVLQELTFQKKKLLKKLAELPSFQQVRDVRFRVGEI